MVLFGYSVVFVVCTSLLQGGEPVCHDCLVVNGTSKLVTTAKVLTYGH